MTTRETAEAAKANFLRAKGQICHALANTPDDRLNWSPSPTARTPLHQVVHAANSIEHIYKAMIGQRFAVPTPAEADAGFREVERGFTTREAALALLDAKSDAYIAFLDGMTSEQLDGMMKAPFGLGDVPVRIALSFPVEHTNWHVAQIDYIQTIYGDLDWHMPGQ